MLVKREVILAGVEGTYNVDPTLTGTDAVLVEEPNWSHESARMIERNPVNTSLAPYQHIYGGSLKTVTFNVEIKGAGAAYSASVRPEIDIFFRACGLAATVVTTPGSETVTYEPASAGHESITIYYYQDGTRHILTGCRGNPSGTLEAGGRVMVAFTMTGHWSTVTDTALVTPTYATTVPPVFVDATFSTDGFAAIIGSLNFDLTNQVVTPPDVNAADGFSEIQIVGRDVNGSFDPEHELVATEDFLGGYTAGTTGVISTGDIGSVQYNQFSISFPVTYYREASPGDRDGIRTLDISFAAIESSGDDEISILFD